MSLFTNVTVDLTIDIIKSKWDVLSTFTNIPEEIFVNLLSFCLGELF